MRLKYQVNTQRYVKAPSFENTPVTSPFAGEGFQSGLRQDPEVRTQVRDGEVERLVLEAIRSIRQR